MSPAGGIVVSPAGGIVVSPAGGIGAGSVGAGVVGAGIVSVGAGVVVVVASVLCFVHHHQPPTAKMMMAMMRNKPVLFIRNYSLKRPWAAFPLPRHVRDDHLPGFRAPSGLNSDRSGYAVH